MTATAIKIPPVLQKFGFSKVEAKRRLFISSEGLESTGKTHFITTAPGPVIAVIDFDRGLEGVVDREEVIGNKLLLRKTLPVPDFDEDHAATMTQGERQQARVSYNSYKQIVEEIIRSGQIGTLAIDNGGDAYTLAQMARFGQIAKVGEVQPQHWLSMQLEFEQILRTVYDHSTNLIVTHRQGSKFRGAVGEMELKGYKKIAFVSQVHLEHLKDREGNLKIRVKKSRQRSALENPEHPQHEHPIVYLDPLERRQSVGGTFLDIATAVFPNTDESDWFPGQ